MRTPRSGGIHTGAAVHARARLPDLLRVHRALGETPSARWSATAGSRPGNIVAPPTMAVSRWGDELYLLTWRTSRVLVYDASTLDFKGASPPMADGWGLTIGGSDEDPYDWYGPSRSCFSSAICRWL